MFGTSNATDLGHSAANDLGGSLVSVTPRWFLPVQVWRSSPSR